MGSENCKHTSAQAAAPRNNTITSEVPRNKTHQVKVGNISIGGGAPVVVQSMLNVDACNAHANLEQVKRLEEAGCEIVRMAIPSKNALPIFEEVCKKSSLPVVADIHFSADLAIAAAHAGAQKLRINPGNIGGKAETLRVIQAAREMHIPIRIGVNAGSLEEDIACRTDLTLPEKLALSAQNYAEFFAEQNFNDIVVSAKAHDVTTCVETYKLLAKTMPGVPLHVGVTEAGTAFQGTIKSASALAILLASGIGDTIRISLTDDPTLEVKAAWTLLGALNMRRRNPELVSCPTCGRCQVDLISIAKEVETRLLHVNKPIKVAVMGCVVNGPGEAREADIGVACGKGVGMLFSHGETLYQVKEDKIIDALMKEIDAL